MVEHLLHTQGVTGSKPVPRTKLLKGKSTKTPANLYENPYPHGRLEKALVAAARAFLREFDGGSSSGTIEPSGQVLSPSFIAKGPPTMRDVINEFLVAKVNGARSDRYLEALRFHLDRFSAGRRLQPLDAITSFEIEAWLEAADWSVKSKANALGTLKTLYSWATKRGYCTKDPIACIELPSLPEQRPCYHGPGRVKEVLTLALAKDPAVCRNLAIRYFAGLRSAETLRLDANDMKAGHIDVCAVKSKTRTRRLVTIQPALAAWLKATPETYLVTDKRFTSFVRSLPFPWPQNVARHSFVSYHLAEFDSPGKTALEAGHSEAMLFRIYREIVTKDQAHAFWAIRP